MSSPPFNVCIIESGNVSLFYEPQTAGSHYLLKKKKKSRTLKDLDISPASLVSNKSGNTNEAVLTLIVLGFEILFLSHRLSYFDSVVEGESIWNSLSWTSTIIFFLIWTHWFKSLTTYSLLLNCNTVRFNRVLHSVLLHYDLEGNYVLCSALQLINTCSYCFYNSRV